MAAAAACSSSVWFVFLLLLAAAFTGSTNAATFTVTNNCDFKQVCPMVTHVSVGTTQLNPGQTWTFSVPAGTPYLSIWGQDGCVGTFADKPTLAEFSIGGGGAVNRDVYDISVIGGFNIGMSITCSTGVGSLVCSSPDWCFGFDRNTKQVEEQSCSANSNYQVTFCPWK